MRIILFLFLLFPLALTANWEHHFSEDEDPSLFHHVHVITGNLNLCLQDSIIQGAQQIPLLRTYSSSGALERTPKNLDLILKGLHKGLLIQGGWSFLPHTSLLVETSSRNEGYAAFLAEKNGQLIPYSFSHQEDPTILFLKPDLPTGQSFGCLSARTNTQNNLLQLNLKTGEAILFLPDGGKRIYAGPSLYKTNLPFLGKCFFYLTSEILPSKHKVYYSYNEQKQLTRISTTNPSGSKIYSWAQFNFLQTKAPFHFQITTSDRKKLSYQACKFENRSYLSEVQSNCRAKEDSYYQPGRKGIGARIGSLHFDGKMQFKASYFLPPDKKQEKKWAEDPTKKAFPADKVSKLEAPIGPKGELIPIAQFSYFPTHTDVLDTSNLLIRYHHDSERLTLIEYFDEKNEVYSSMKFIWNEGRLYCKALLNAQKEPIFAKTFQYDALGNVLEETIWGNLTGKAATPFSIDNQGNIYAMERYQKTYAYLPHFNLPILEEEEEGPTYQYTYKPDTDLLTAKFTCDPERKILKREFFLYNEDNLLVAEIVDDGSSSDPTCLDTVTVQIIKKFVLDPQSGLPTAITESYLDLPSTNEILLKRVEYTYSPEKQIISEAVFDSQNSYRYTLYADYDKQGRLIRKTTPLGQENCYVYDPLGSLLESTEAGRSKKIYTYDAAGRPRSCQEVNSLKETWTHYDEKGRLVSQTDAKGNTTYQNYDAFGRCLETHFPKVQDERGTAYAPVVRFAYDVQGNITSTTTPKGETTQTTYNALRKPVQIRQAEGTLLLHFYNKNGSLAKTIYPDQTEIHYTYDLFQRMTSKTVYSSDNEQLSKESWTYNTFHLLSHTAPNGLITKYTYDGAGRKIAEEAEGRKKIYSYDALGFLEKTQEGEISYIQIKNVEGQVTSQWNEDSAGLIENKMFFFYNKNSLKEKAIRWTSQGEATDLFSYDHENRLTSHTDPYGAKTHFLYEEIKNELGQSVLQKTTLDPLGNASIETYDGCNRLVLCQRKNPEGAIIGEERFCYDSSGNQSKRISTSYLLENPLKTLCTSWEYDPLGRVTKEIKADKTVTLTHYDSRGRIFQKILPSGVALSYFYDGLNRLLELISSDKTIHYQYLYESSMDPVEIIDLVQKNKLKRSYNLFGELLQEMTPSGLKLAWDYDEMGRCTHFTLPNASSISYFYIGAHLTTIRRRSPSFTYDHHYTSFDPNGHVAEEELIYALGTVETTHDLMERSTSQSSSWLSHSTTYGPSGLVIEAKNTLLGDKQYAYDPLNQLLKENEQEYLFDSLGNPSHCEVNNCNQVLTSPDSHLLYDLNGNPTERITRDQIILYSYDALSRLTAITYPQQKKILYFYDPLSRLSAKETYTYQEGLWQKEDKLLYLYDQDHEIGTLNPQGELLQLKVLGLGIQGDIGAAVAIELGTDVFAPLHDGRGNIIALITPLGQLAETYQIDAFGKEPPSSSPPLNPWRFSSKRSEEGLVFFGERFYDPSLGRWLTPDPAGFTEGPNLYVYVLNNPLNRLDLFGLTSQKNAALPLRIEISFPVTIALPSLETTLPCKIFIRNVEMDGFIFCGYLHKLKFTPEELSVGTINILDHFNELIPKEGTCMGLITLLNGIKTGRKDLKNMCFSLQDKIQENTLLLGIHNPSWGTFLDADRLADELAKEETPIVANTRQILSALLQGIHKVNPEMLWLHIAHSEGSLITQNAAETMTPEEQTLLQQHFYFLTLGGPAPISKKLAFGGINIYSEKDHVAQWYAKHFFNNPDYDISVIPCISPKGEWSGGIADHAFMGSTYQTALTNDMRELSTKFGFYDGKAR